MEAAFVDQRVEQFPHVERLVLVRRNHTVERVPQRSRSGDDGCRFVTGGRQVGEVALGDLDALLVGLDEHVPATRDAGVHARPAHLLERDLLADHHLGHARRAEVHRGVALAHDHDVAEGRDVGAAGGARAEQHADLRHHAGEFDLVVEDPPRAAPPREHPDLLGDAGSGRVDEVDNRDPASSARSWMRRIFSTVFGPQEPALTVGSLAITATGRPSTVPTPVTTPSAPSPSCSQLARSPSSTNEPSSRSSATRSRTGSLPCSSALSRWRCGPPARPRSIASWRVRSSLIGDGA